MEGEQRVRRNLDGAEDANAFSSVAFQLWENALEKLKALNYEQGLCKPCGVAPFTRCYFAIPGSNPGAQFRSFQEAAVWLVTAATGDASAYRPDKFDDPSTSVNKLVLALKPMGFGMDFPINKLKQAHGEAVCAVLDFLADKALAAKGFQWGLPIHRSDEADVQDVAPDEGDPDEIEDDAEVAEEEPDEGLASTAASARDHRDSEGFNASDSNVAILEAKIDPTQWKQELERVGPKLRTAQPQAGREWRAHVAETAEHDVTVSTALPETSAQLAAVAGEVSDALERVRTKERYVGTQYQALQAEYREANGRCKEAQSKVTAVGGRVTELSNELTRLTEELDEVKDSMSERGNQMSEASPLVSLKQSLQRVKAEIKTFDLRIGIVSHSLTALKVRRMGSAHGSSRGGGGGGGVPADLGADFLDGDGIEGQ